MRRRSAVATGVRSVTLEVNDLRAAEAFHRTAFDLGARLTLTESPTPTGGFRGFTLSLVVSQPADVDALVGAALDSGATALKPVGRSFWGYGGVVQAPDGSIWKVASSSKRSTAPAGRDIDDVVLLLGVSDMTASRAFYVDRGLEVARSFGRRYTEFTAEPGEIKLALYGRRELAKDAGVSPEGSGSHRLVLHSDSGPFTDPDGFTWAAP